MKSISEFMSHQKNALIVGGTGAALALTLAWLLPHEREVTSLAIFLLKLVPFGLLATGIACLHAPSLIGRWFTPLLIAPFFLVVFCFFVPKIFFHLDDFHEVYYHALMMVPVIILALELAFKLGGASAAACLRLSFGLLTLMLSGIEDLAFLVVNHHTDPRWATIPEVWNWASHMKVRLGFYPTKHQAYAFIAFHLMLAFAILAWPPKWRWPKAAIRAGA